MGPVKQRGRSQGQGQRLILASGGPEWCRADAGEVRAIEAGEALAASAAHEARNPTP